MGEPAGLEEGARPRAELRELRGHGVWGVPGRRGGVGLEKGNEGVSREAGAGGGEGAGPAWERRQRPLPPGGAAVCVKVWEPESGGGMSGR